VDQFLAEIQATFVPFTRGHIAIFVDAFRRYGKGRHCARLNMGDCFTCAVAIPVLFAGEDFTRTDLKSA
jgi:ribonuclease VapC